MGISRSPIRQLNRDLQIHSFHSSVGGSLDIPFLFHRLLAVEIIVHTYKSGSWFGQKAKLWPKWVNIKGILAILIDDRAVFGTIKSKTNPQKAFFFGIFFSNHLKRIAK